MGLTLRLSLLKMKIHHFCLAILIVIVGQVAAFGQVTNIKDGEEVIAVDVEPKALNLDSVKRLIQHPEKLKQKGIRGEVVTVLLINEKGLVYLWFIKETTHQDLSEEIWKYIHFLRFSPAMKDGKAIEVWFKVPFTFE